jgi:hypothetical protein
LLQDCCEHTTTSFVGSKRERGDQRIEGSERGKMAGKSELRTDFT